MCFSKQSGKHGFVGGNIDEDDELSDDAEMSYMSSKASFLKNQQRPKSPSNKSHVLSLA